MPIECIIICNYNTPYFGEDAEFETCRELIDWTSSKSGKQLMAQALANDTERYKGMCVLHLSTLLVLICHRLKV